MKRLLVMTCAAVAIAAALADSRAWRGGDGNWGDSAMWNPNGIPGTSAGDVATFPVRATQTVTVGDDVTLHRIDIAAKVPNVQQIYNIASGKTLMLDLFNLYKDTAADDIVICGGGTLALTNSPLYASGSANPIRMTISGAGTMLYMPKETSSGLYVGSVDNNYPNSPDVFRVTADARAIISNATCIGNNYAGGTIGKLVVDDGGYFYGGKILYVGRGARVPGGVVCAVTNATLEADKIGVGAGWYQEFVGRNAVVKATDYIAFPHEEYGEIGSVRYSIMDFEDSTFVSPTIALLQGNSLSTGKLSRCVLTCDVLKGCLGQYCRDSRFDFVDSVVTCAEVRVSAAAASNSLLRSVNSDFVCNKVAVGFEESTESMFRVEGGTVRTGVLHAGVRPTATESRYEQVGGALTATNSIVAGSFDSRHCGAVFRGVSLTTPVIVCGDSVSYYDGNAMCSSDAYLEFADMARMDAGRLLVGYASIGANMLVTNTSASVTYSAVDDASSTMVGISAGATRNTLTLVDSTMSQTGGNLYLGRWSYATNNTLRLVRSTYDFRTINSKGDVIVGFSGDANGNRVELLDHSTFSYDRKWMAIGQFASSNVWFMAGGSSLNASATTFALGVNSSAVGNRLALGGDCSFAVGTLSMNYKAVLEVAGTNNTMTLGNAISLTDGCSYLFRPGSESSDTPMLTINQAFQYSENRPIHVDLSNAGQGRYALLSSPSEIAAPVVGSSVIFHNVPDDLRAKATRSADGRTLFCVLPPKGTKIIVR